MSLTIVIAIVFVLCIGILLCYLFVSNQHRVIADELRELDQLVGDNDGGDVI